MAQNFSCESLLMTEESSQHQHPEAKMPDTSEITNIVNLSHQVTHKMTKDNPFSKAEITTFQNSGWPRFLEIAKDNSLNPSEMFKLMHETLKLSAEVMSENNTTLSEAQIGLQQHQEILANLISWLSTLPVKKWSAPKNQTYIIKIMWNFVHSGLWASTTEHSIKGSSKVNPLKPLSASQIELIFETLEEVAEDATLKWLSNDEQQKKLKDPLYLQNQELTLEHQTDLNEFEVSKDLKIPSKKAEEDSPEVTEYPLEHFLIDSKSVLRSDILYYFENATGRRFSITFSKDVVKAFKKGQESPIRRLITTLFSKAGSLTGIKFLNTPQSETFNKVNIVEIKSIIRGHKRLVGWLSGNHLHVEFFNDGESTNSYQRLFEALRARLNTLPSEDRLSF